MKTLKKQNQNDKKLMVEIETVQYLPLTKNSMVFDKQQARRTTTFHDECSTASSVCGEIKTTTR